MVEKRRRVRDVCARGCSWGTVCFVAEYADKFAGHGTLLWASTYPPLLDAVEAVAAERGTDVGLGVGSYAAYGAAQRI